ncbi:hypothetical protein [Pseudonocardia sp. WMMC193]|uniref:hypothetical protein n=1 Tax=Pseudonocardia sp. WMMC193 TaxID=2911965 RepID=UPI001F4264C8|nr:hypothetical protein [Pseudonocardia sp. WMMC193]MCF7547617.1 hypothetical protein [Pseudonocardia sp. WMMC193]
MTELVLGEGTRVRIAPPILPRIEVAPPSATRAVVVPVVGPPGPPGEPGPGAVVLDDLEDVEAPSGVAGLLERQGDGVVRAVPRDEITSEWFQGHGAPPPVIPGAKRGDMYVDLDSGAFYQLG